VAEADNDIQKAYDKAIDILERAGHKIIHKNMTNTKYDIATYYIIATAEATTKLGKEYDGN